MAKAFNVIDSEINSYRLMKDVRDRTLECRVPRCWNLKYNDDAGQMYLDRTMNDGDGGAFVQMRRYLFWIAYKYVPDRHKLIALCKNHRCQNPAHMTYKHHVISPKKIAWFIDKGWLSVKDAKKWYNFELGDENVE